MNNGLTKKHMEPVDAVKRLYQSEFGCGHLLAEEMVCAAAIGAEIASAKPLEGAHPYEDIGDGLCRLNLHAPAVRELRPVLIARMMEATARIEQGSLVRFLQKLEGLKADCAAGKLPFDLPELVEYLERYAQEGYPMVSHSQAYREAYDPAYRVVSKVYGRALPLIAMAEKRLREEGRALLVLEGDCAAGKSTLASALAPLWEAAILSMDDFFLPAEMRTAQRLAIPGGNIHHERFAAEVLEGLLAGRETLAYQRYHCHTGQNVPAEAAPGPVLVIEGSYSQHPAFDEAYNRLHALRVFLKVEPQEQLRRLGVRNPALLPRFQQEWIPLEKAYFGAYDREGKADIVLCNEGEEP